MSSVVSVEDLGYRYARRWAVRDLTFDVPRGAVYGLLGPNGSGKSTTLRLLLGLLRRREGRVDVLGIDPRADPVGVKRVVGYVSEQPAFYPWMRVGELFDFVAHHRPEWDAAFAEDLCRRLGLERRPRTRELSKGERSMTALVLALAFRPRLLLLDEPTGALDPSARRGFLEGVLEGYQEEGGTILVSSHLIHEISGMVDHVGVIDGGRLVVSQGVDALRRTVRRYRLLFDDEAPAEIGCPGRLHVVSHLREAEVTVRLTSDDDREVRAALAAHGPSRVEVETLPLEEIFLALVGRAPA